jgi:hypothetical protein
MRLWLVFIVLFFRNTTSSGTKIDHEVERHLQSTPQTTYRANYSADFQHFHEVLCDGAPPVLLVGCKGPSSGMTVSTSDDRIVCEESDQFSLFQNATSTAYECTINCTETDAACQSIYSFETELFDPIRGPFGSIFFQCEGNTVDEIDAAFVYRGTSNGTCNASTSDTISGRNYHIGRLGVLCPVGNGSSDHEYVFDDTFAECRSLDSFTIDLDSIDSTDIFACVSGMKCGGQECFFPFLEFSVEASVPNFLDTCVDSYISYLEYSAQFEASWSVVFDPLESSTSCFTDKNPVAFIACQNNSIIEYVNSTDSSISCVMITGHEMSCGAYDGLPSNQLVSVLYVCLTSFFIWKMNDNSISLVSLFQFDVPELLRPYTSVFKFVP